jgi:signal transduction histidine kinase
MLEHKLKILHLEDTAFDVEMVERELKKGNINFDKIVVDNKKAFEKALVSFVPDIVLSDHSLPSFDSLGALDLVKQLAPATPFILVTATVSEEFAVTILQKGASDYILKTNMKRLPSAVMSAIEKSKMAKDKELSEQELVRSYQQVRKLASHLQDIREEERASMAREIHDELGQQMTAMKLDFAWLTLKLRGAEAEIVEKISSMEKLLGNALVTVKKIATELHPAMLDKLGFIEAIRWQSREFEKRVGIKINLDLPESIVNISGKVSIALFRIYQESLTNIARHSQARNVSCSLQKNGDLLSLTVIDDGKGFDVSTIEQMQSLGLLGMKERSVMIGGSYEVMSEPGNGTRVHVTLPVTEQVY